MPLRKHNLTPSSSDIRIAVVQHGDYREALELRASGVAEPYFGMYNTLDGLEQLLGGYRHLVISLDSPSYREDRGLGTLVGLPAPPLLRWLPQTVSMLRWSQLIRRELIDFAPTHLLVRAGGVLAWRVLNLAIRRWLNAAVVFANILPTSSRYDRLLARLLVKQLHSPQVRVIGNYRHTATRLLLEAGAPAEKVAAYDYGDLRQPKDFPPRQLINAPAQAPSILFVGNLIVPKGLEDLIDAVALLHSQGMPVDLAIAGDGPDRSFLEACAARSGLPPERVRFLGRISNDRAFELMRECTLVCVPTRHDFPESGPMTLTEALAGRTPVVISDHPVFRASFVEGEGVCFFRSKDAASLAAAARRLLTDPAKYAALSATSDRAFAKVECSTTLSDLFRRWAATFHTTSGNGT